LYILVKLFEDGIPPNHVVHIYDPGNGTSRAVFGPNMVKLGPTEQLSTVTHASNRYSSLRYSSLPLDEDTKATSETVETSDHIKIIVQLKVTWRPNVSSKSSPSDIAQLFNKDITNVILSDVGSLIRKKVSTTSFTNFHSGWSDIIQKSVFESSELSPLYVISKLDIVSINTADKETRSLLEQAVKEAVAMTAENTKRIVKNSLEMSALREMKQAEFQMQKATINDEIQQENEKSVLLEIKAKNKNEECIITNMEKKHETERELSVEREKAKIEADKFAAMVSAIGRDTFKVMAESSKAASMVKGLGLKGFMITDSKHPLNLVETAKKMLDNTDALVEQHLGEKKEAEITEKKL